VQAWLQNHPEDAARVRAWAAHAVYVPEQRHPVEVLVQQGDATQRQQQQQHLSQWLSKRLSAPVILFNLRPEGFELVGGAPAARHQPPRRPVDVPAARRPAHHGLRAAAREPPRAANEPEVHTGQMAGLDLSVWYEGGTGCALVGSLPRVQRQKLADVMHAQAEEAAEGQTWH
jgi:anti-sigma factor RsiW